MAVDAHTCHPKYSIHRLKLMPMPTAGGVAKLPRPLESCQQRKIECNIHLTTQPLTRARVLALSLPLRKPTKPLGHLPVLYLMPPAQHPSLLRSNPARTK